jgi:hypothetical protein
MELSCTVGNARSARLPVRFLWAIGLVGALFIGAMVVAFPSRGGFGNDLMPSYAAGVLINEGRGDELFNPYTVTRIVRQTWAATYTEPLDPARTAPWLNPPFYALAFAPLARLPYARALGVWVTINAALAVVATALLVRLLPRGTPWSVKGLVPLGLVTAFPFVQVVTHQQNTFVSLTILAAACGLAMRAMDGRRFTATARVRYAWVCGAVAGLMFFKPQLGLGMVTALGVIVGFRAVLGAAATGAVLVLIGETVIPGSTVNFIYQLPAALAVVQEKSGYPWSRQATLMAFWRTLLQGADAAGPTWPIVRMLWAVSVAGVMAMLAITARWVRTASGNHRPAAAQRWLAVAVACVPLVMPYYMDYDLLLLVAAATLFAGAVLHAGELSRADRRLAWAWAGLWAWLLFQPTVAGGWRVNGTVVVIAAIALLMTRSVREAVIGSKPMPVVDDEDPGADAVEPGRLAA